MNEITLDMAINKWFDMKLKAYDKLEHDNSIYLYDDQEYADIRIDKSRKILYYNFEISQEFFRIFSIKQYEFEKFMSQWVKDTFNLTGLAFYPRSGYSLQKLKVPR